MYALYAQCMLCIPNVCSVCPMLTGVLDHMFVVYMLNFGLSRLIRRPMWKASQSKLSVASRMHLIVLPRNFGSSAKSMSVSQFGSRLGTSNAACFVVVVFFFPAERETSILNLKLDPPQDENPFIISEILKLRFF